MNFNEIQQEAIDIRFNESQRESVKRWINTRYQALWALAEWPWKRQGPTAIAVTAGNANPTLPSDFNRPLQVYDDLGDRLMFLAPDDFDHLYLYGQLQGSPGRPSAVKWVNQVLTLGPVPDTDYDFQLVYERGATFLQGGTTPVTGLMAGDTDEPIWDEGFHYVLVLGALGLGLRLENDPTYDQVEEDFTSMLQAMQEYYLPTASPSGNVQFGREEY